MTCTYHENRFAICEAPATHRLAFDTVTGRPLGFVLAEGEREQMFCLTDAGKVSQGLQQRWQAAKEARPRLPQTRHSATPSARTAREGA